MKKLVIADDDFLVRAYLKQMIPWEEKGFVIAGDAKNGEEAWKLIEREHPSLLMTDSVSSRRSKKPAFPRTFSS